MTAGTVIVHTLEHHTLLAFGRFERKNKMKIKKTRLNQGQLFAIVKKNPRSPISSALSMRRPSWMSVCLARAVCGTRGGDTPSLRVQHFHPVSLRTAKTGPKGTELYAKGQHDANPTMTFPHECFRRSSSCFFLTLSP